MNGSLPGLALGPLLPVIIGLVGILLLGCISPRFARAARLVCVLSLAGSFLLSAALWLRGGGATDSGFNELLRQDKLSLFWQILFSLGALPLALLLRAEDEIPFALTLAAVFGMGLLAAANHLFVLFLGLETMSLATYLLVYKLRQDADSLEAAVKYFFSGALAAAFYLLGMVVYYSATGDMALARQNPPSAAVILAQALMLSAALFKVGAFPMGFWLPDAYEASAPELVAFMSTAVKASGFLIFLRLLPLAASGEGLVRWLPALSLATMTVGNLTALIQERVQRLLAYSSIAHAGYLLAGVWAWSRLGFAPDAAASICLYLGTYLFMSAGAFVCLASADVRDVRGLRGLAARSPGLAAFLCLMILSLAAIPPTAGFLAKFFIFWDILRAGGTWLAAAAALNSLVALGYYFRLIREMVLEPSELAPGAPVSASARVLLWACAAPLTLFGVSPLLRSWIEAALR